MKVLIETLNNRKGYKFFENREEMDAYLGRHCNNISSYKILQEDDTASTNDILQGLAEDCEVIHNKLFYLFRQQEKLKKSKQYELRYIHTQQMQEDEKEKMAFIKDILADTAA